MKTRIFAYFLCALTVPAHAMDAGDAGAKCRVAIKAAVLFPDAVTFGAHDAKEDRPGIWTVNRVVTYGGRTWTILCVVRDGRVVGLFK